MGELVGWGGSLVNQVTLWLNWLCLRECLCVVGQIFRVCVCCVSKPYVCVRVKGMCVRVCVEWLFIAVFKSHIMSLVTTFTW